LKNSFNKKNQKNEGQIEKKNFNWKMKLKAKKTLAKGLRKKITNQKNKDQNEKKTHKKL